MASAGRILAVTLAALAGSLTSAAAVAAAAPAPAQAPGRVVFPVDGGVVSNDDDGGAATAAVALPDGGAVLVGNGGGTGRVHTYVAEITAAGSLDPAFGTRGIATLPGIEADQIVEEADGSLIVAGSGTATDKSEYPPIVLVHLNADGTIDSSFGTDGVETTTIESACGDCAAVSALPGGELAVTGDTGPAEAAPGPTPPATQWVVARLTPTGALDPSFGQAGIVTLLPTAGNGTAVAGLGNGDIVALGNLVGGGQTVSVLTRLLPSGAADPTFNGGSLIVEPAGVGASMVADPDGTVLVSGAGTVVRYTSGGLPDPSFGAGGIAHLVGFTAPTIPAGTGTSQDLPAKLLATPGDGAVAYYVEDGGAAVVERLTPSGGVDPTQGGGGAKQLGLGFGGGATGPLVTIRPRALPPLDQDSADVRGGMVERPDGSFLAFDGAFVAEGTGEGEGRSSFDFAVAGLTPSFTADTSFGGPATPLHAKLRVIRQRASTARSRHGILVELTLSQPGLARVVIRAHGRAVAENVLPIFAPGEATLPVELTSYGSALLRNHHGIKLTASLTGRDLLTNTATATSAGTLR
jgi:uncharacterized delta-60 repeat protein